MITAAVQKGMGMIDFVLAVCDPANQFLRLALGVATLASVSFGVIGTYVVTRRISYLAGAISHCVFGGIGAGLYIQHGLAVTWFNPMYGAVCSAILAAIIIGLVSLYAGQREDTVIGALWAMGMAAGLLFIDRTPGYFDIGSYLFGDILLISANDFQLVLLLDVLVVGLCLVFYNKLLAVCFDEEFARACGVKTGVYYLTLLCLTALTIVLLVRVVGILLVIALLTIPAAVASLFTSQLWRMMVIAVILCLVFSWLGLAVSYAWEISTGPVIIMVAGVFYVILLLVVSISGKNR